MPVPPVTNTALLDTSNKKNQTKGTGFTNINSILDANKGAGEKIGNKIGSQLNQQADSVRAGIQQSQGQFNTQKNAAGQQANNAVQAGQALTRQAGETDDAYTNRVSQGGQDYSQIGQNLRDANYNGPTQLTNAGKLQAQGSNIAGLGQLAGNTQGQTQLLQSMVAKPGQYTRGQSALDQLLLGQSGQQAIQQGRRSTLGLGEYATGAENQAEAQANALKSGISTGKTNAINGLQTAVTGTGGFQEQARNQAAAFQKDATDLASVMAGTFDVSTPAGQERARSLIDKMDQFGVDDYNLYNKDEDQTKGAVGNLASTLATQFGASKYTDPQKQAALNLSNVLGDKGLNNEITNANFNTNVFGNETDSFSGLDKTRNYDTETKGILDKLSGSVKGIEDNMVSSNDGKMNQYIGEINARTDLSPAQKQSYIDYVTENHNLNNQKLLSPTADIGTAALLNWQRASGAAGPGDQMSQNALINELFNNYGDFKSRINNPESLREYDKYGWLRFADRQPGANQWGGTEDADMNRFNGLGLQSYGGTTGSGDIRSSSDLNAASGRVMGQDAKLKDFVLNKILGLTNPSAGIDPSTSKPKILKQV